MPRILFTRRGEFLQVLSLSDSHKILPFVRGQKETPRVAGGSAVPLQDAQRFVTVAGARRAFDAPAVGVPLGDPRAVGGSSKNRSLPVAAGSGFSHDRFPSWTTPDTGGRIALLVAQNRLCRVQWFVVTVEPSSTLA